MDLLLIKKNSLELIESQGSTLNREKGRTLVFVFAIFSIFFLPLSSHAATLAAPPNNLGLVLYQSMNEGGGSISHDSSGNGYHGTLTNTPTWVNGKRGKALQFNGSNEYTTVPNFTWAGGPVTVSFWNYVSSADAQEGSAFGMDVDAGTSRFQAHVPWDDENLYWDYGNASGNGRITADYSNYLNKWTHVTLQSEGDGGDYRAIYLDGVLVNSLTSASGGPTVTLNGLNIGYTDETPDYMHKGSIDDFRIYNRILTESEIKRLYQSNTVSVKAASNTGLVGYWSMDEGGGSIAHDQSGNGYNGSLQGSPSWVDGKRGKTLQFNGSSQYVDLSNPSMPTTNFSVSAWVYANPGSFSAGDQHQIISKGYDSGSNTTQWQLAQFGASGEVNFGTYVSGVSHAVISSGGITAGTWAHIIGTYDGTTYRIYINGVLNNSNNASGPVATNNKLIIGAVDVNGTPGQYFNGKIDEVRVFNRVLNIDDVKNIYNSGLIVHNASTNSKLTDGLVGLWSFNGPDLSGTTAYDRSGQGNDGTLVASPTVTFGKIGQALSFNGSSQYINASNVDFGLNNTTQTSVSFWIKSSDATGRIIQKQTSDGWNTILVDWGTTAGATGKIGFSVQNDSLEEYPTWYNSTAIDSNWHHFVATFNKNAINSSDGKIYIDGVEVSTTYSANGYSSSFVLEESSNNLLFGVRPVSITDYFNGSLDDVRIYNRELSASEVKQLYNMGR